ncbi:4'-phosphopantetheinyl transferase family protein [Butyrivibrio sp. WCD3002]|uniref:4'-phosphopantetheinyl transferase family protein n=1 Tax=Butyrivibrio sp. WCD3002 TaxID=1280676 RepID=UPI00042807F2|nr:4'-phosphopantetheinyl transferase superfamily protein [Butyrivibrio sp. WCD3002]
MKIYYSNVHNLIEQAGADDAILEDLMKKVDKERIEKAVRFKRLPDKVSSLVGGALIQTALKDYIQESKTQKFSPEDVLDISYVLVENGKPYVKNYPSFHFSLSHSGNYVALVTADIPVGIDVQEERVSDPDKLAERFYSDKENEILRKIEDDEERSHMFFRIWSAKEAYIKMTGYGLQEDLSGFHISFDDMEIRKGSPEATAGYIIEPLPLIGNVLTVCIGERTDNINLQEVVF